MNARPADRIAPMAVLAQGQKYELLAVVRTQVQNSCPLRGGMGQASPPDFMYRTKAIIATVPEIGQHPQQSSGVASAAQVKRCVAGLRAAAGGATGDPGIVRP